jgi:hypothetical protein
MIQHKYMIGAGPDRWKHHATMSRVSMFILLIPQYLCRSLECRHFSLRAHSWSLCLVVSLRNSARKTAGSYQTPKHPNTFHIGALVSWIVSQVSHIDSYYITVGSACFVCEAAGESNLASIGESTDCSRCGPSVILDWKKPQCILEHMAAHILFDMTLNSSEERCGLCLRPAPMCQLYIKKGRGKKGCSSIDQKRSTCPNLVQFSYASATTSSESSPCSNVPTACTLCPEGSPAVWTYSLHTHYRVRHRLSSTAHFPTQISLARSETDGMKHIWNAHFTITKSHKKHRAIPSLPISDAHQPHVPLKR